MLLLILGFVIIIIVDFLPLIHQKNKVAIVVFILLFIFAFVYNLLLLLNVEITSSLVIVSNFFKSLGLSYPPPT